jgi:hypothetical protein
MHFQRLHFLDSALMPNRTAEASLQKRLNQFPSQRRPNYLTAEGKNVHVVVFNALVSGEDIVNEPRAHASNLVGADGRPHTASAKRYSAINFGGGHSSGQWDHVVGIIVAGARLKSPEVDNLICSFAEQIRDLLFQNEPSMI